MQDHECSNWSIGLKFVQFMKNRALHSGIKRAPYEAMFGCAPKVGLSSTLLPNEVLNAVTNEEDLENILKTVDTPYNSIGRDSPINTLANDTVTNELKNCVGCLAKCTEEITCAKCKQPLHHKCSKMYELDANITQICMLCFNNINIEIERNAAKDCLENQAKRMKLLSDKSHADVSEGMTVRIQVPLLYVTEDVFTICIFILTGTRS